MTRTLPEPKISPELADFWAATRDGRLLVRACRSCDSPHWYPRTICPFCGSPDTEWRDHDGTGTIVTYSVMRRAPVPYVTAYVELTGGPTLLTNVMDCDPDALAIGQAVRAVFPKTEAGEAWVMFTPA
ncbi:Zn-ribbon domain-containing OB-fold protein [Chachezhania sediminis]|uniref:Zn-ribbon domain-containing OB-fold protein n=1 Tax=Chachezhania sediminis TaxID=2599291 RepID=UPI00131CC25C|nr:OB-fold domain-containing protein [Chachezhania sediminis]